MNFATGDFVDFYHPAIALGKTLATGVVVRFYEAGSYRIQHGHSYYDVSSFDVYEAEFYNQLKELTSI